MTFLTFDEAQTACADELASVRTAEATMASAWDALQAAKSDLASARSVLDGSTFASGAAVVGVIIACLLPEPFSKSICVAGIVGGGLAVTGSEVDRQSDITSAENAVAVAQVTYDVSVSLYEAAFAASFGCLIHHMSKG